MVQCGCFHGGRQVSFGGFKLEGPSGRGAPETSAITRLRLVTGAENLGGEKSMLSTPTYSGREWAEVQRGVQAALGEIPADVVLQCASLVNVHTDEIYLVDILISGEKVVAIVEPGTGKGLNTIKCDGLFAVPGLIDGHVHIESSAVRIGELARMIVPRGVTTLLADPHEIANVLGIDGIKLLLEDAERTPIRVLLQVPARVPTAPGVETTGGSIGLAEVVEMLSWSNTVSLGEMDPSKVVPPIREYVAKIEAARKARRICNGHAADMSGRLLNAYASVGCLDDHECVSAEGARERARLGMTIIGREATFTHNVKSILRAVSELGVPSRNIIMCTDDKLPHEIVAEGHIDHNIRVAVQSGIPVTVAIQMATVNCAQHFRIDDMVGSVAPGRYADIALVSDLEAFKVERVLIGGRIVAQDGELIEEPARSELPHWALDTVRLRRKLTPEDFRIACARSGSKAKALVIDIEQASVDLVKRALVEEVSVEDSQVMADLQRDILKIGVVERHKGTGNIGLGLIKGFGLKRGALASSVCHDHHNIAVVGTNDEDMAVAVNALAEMRGGFVAVKDGIVIGSVPLEFAGLMSIEPYEETVRRLLDFERVSKVELGCTLQVPIMTLACVCLPSVPEVGITDLGVVRIGQLDRVPHLVNVVLGGTES